MSDLIPLAELLSEIDREIKRVPACAATLQRARSIALTIPTVEAEPVVHAYWEGRYEVNMNLGDWRLCTACGWDEWGKPEKGSPFCPNCGARMEADAPERA